MTTRIHYLRVAQEFAETVYARLSDAFPECEISERSDQSIVIALAGDAFARVIGGEVPLADDHQLFFGELSKEAVLGPTPASVLNLAGASSPLDSYAAAHFLAYGWWPSGRSPFQQVKSFNPQPTATFTFAVDDEPRHAVERHLGDQLDWVAGRTVAILSSGSGPLDEMLERAAANAGATTVGVADARVPAEATFGRALRIFHDTAMPLARLDLVDRLAAAEASDADCFLLADGGDALAATAPRFARIEKAASLDESPSFLRDCVFGEIALTSDADRLWISGTKLLPDAVLAMADALGAGSAVDDEGDIALRAADLELSYAAPGWLRPAAAFLQRMLGKPVCAPFANGGLVDQVQEQNLAWRSALRDALSGQAEARPPAASAFGAMLSLTAPLQHSSFRRLGLFAPGPLDELIAGASRGQDRATETLWAVRALAEVVLKTN